MDLFMHSVLQNGESEEAVKMAQDFIVISEALKAGRRVGRVMLNFQPMQ
jgi:hypothetical protein